MPGGHCSPSAFAAQDLRRIDRTKSEKFVQGVARANAHQVPSETISANPTSVGLTPAGVLCVVNKGRDLGLATHPTEPILPARLACLQTERGPVK